MPARMKRSIRPSTPEDAPAIVSLFGELGMEPNSRPEDLQWKYWAERADWPGPRSFVLISDGAIVAHAAIIPGALLRGNRRSTTGHLIDWGAHRGQAGAGMALMRHIAQQLDCLLAFGGSDDTLRILPHLGFRPAGVLTGYARPLHPLRVLTKRVDFSWRLLPRLARSGMWKLAAPRHAPDAWRRRAVTDAAGIAGLIGCMPVSNEGAVIMERSPELMRYALQCPIAATTLYTLERDGRAFGYFMLACVPGQVRIVDCWMSSAALADWQALIHHAVSQASHDPQAAEVVLWASGSMLSTAVRSCGFHARFQLPIQIRMSSDVAVPPGALDVRMLDNDAAYLHEGHRSHWA